VAERLSVLSRPATPSLEVRLLGPAERFLKLIRDHGIGVATQANGTVVLQGPPDELADQVWRLARESGVGVRSITPSRNSLEEIFIKAVREERPSGE
jgi:hypothetical protein